MLRNSGFTASPHNSIDCPRPPRRSVALGLLFVALRLGSPPRLAAQIVTEKATTTYVEISPHELAREIPELKHLEVSESQDLLPEILKNAGKTVAAFFDSFTSTSCTEHVTSMVEPALGEGKLHFDRNYNYVAMVGPGILRESLKEYRTDENGTPVAINASAEVVTEGFVNQLVHFHPVYQPDSDFRFLGRQNLDRQRTCVVAFAQRPSKARQTTYVNFLDRHGVVYMQGIAWIDPVNFRILRLRTDIELPELKVGLLKETTEIVYSRVSFQNGTKTLWLPRAVTVSGQIDQYTFHNQHRYSDYRLFNVQVDEKHQLP